MQKYRSKKVTVDGITFDSKKEARRYAELKLLEKAGEIYGLELQTVFELVPAYYEARPTGEYYKRGEKKGQPKFKNVCIEKAITYKADFVYRNKNGEMIVEDTKGFRTTDYILKRKMMLYFHDIKITEM